MAKKKIRIASIDALPEVAEEVLQYCGNKKIFAFLGELGAGKTTVIDALCRVLGSTDKVSSPTFSIVNEYRGREQIFHIDLYRLKSLDEALEIGIDDYLAGDRYCFIEWPQLIEPLLPADTIYATLQVLNEYERLMTIEKP